MFLLDEATSMNKLSLEAIDRKMQEIRGNTNIMGNAVVLLSGDFRQTLPVVARGTPADELDACLKSSNLWQKVTKFNLKTNMRVLSIANAETNLFSEQLLELGNGNFAIDPQSGEIEFPENFCQLQSSINELVSKVYPNIETNYIQENWLYERAILAPTNEEVDKLNHQILFKIPGNMIEYNSIDTMTKEDEAVNYPTEFLNSLQPTGMPPHILKLKVGAILMILRNLNPPKLCNETRVIVKKLTKNLIEATILTGKYKGEEVLIPRIPIISTDMPFEFKRMQFPVKLAFAMTINKAQGQTLKVVGLNLTKSCFSHGQLYVGCSRVGTPKALFIYT
ncbi:MAG: hypothetical protein EOP45_20325, partial [Sphingobacteriaceae bacterium]